MQRTLGLGGKKLVILSDSGELSNIITDELRSEAARVVHMPRKMACESSIVSSIFHHNAIDGYADGVINIIRVSKYLAYDLIYSAVKIKKFAKQDSSLVNVIIGVSVITKIILKLVPKKLRTNTIILEHENGNIKEVINNILFLLSPMSANINRYFFTVK